MNLQTTYKVIHTTYASGTSLKERKVNVETFQNIDDAYQMANEQKNYWLVENEKGSDVFKEICAVDIWLETLENGKVIGRELILCADF